MTLIIAIVCLLAVVALGFMLWRSQQKNVESKLFANIQQLFQQLQNQHNEHQLKTLTSTQEYLQKGMQDTRLQLQQSLQQQSQGLSQLLDKMAKDNSHRLQEVAGIVDKRLNEGFEKTNATFTDVVKRLAIIDSAQKRITELSSNVLSLQEILADKKSRGAFGEVQLANLVQNMLPEKHFQLQASLSNGKRVDCLLILPEPTGNIAIDAKFPLESYRALTNTNTSPSEIKAIEAQFKQDVKKHIQDIHDKYIISQETADGAMMFIPAEAIFAEIHANHSELVEFAHRLRVWLVSPTTMMAVLTTAKAVLKDAATRKQVHIIQEHLVKLAKDFDRFQQRMDKLNQHISQAKKDVDDVHISSQKISSRFEKIEQVELTDNDEDGLLQ